MHLIVKFKYTPTIYIAYQLVSFVIFPANFYGGILGNFYRYNFETLFPTIKVKTKEKYSKCI